MATRDVGVYVVAQVAGGMTGAVTADLMFGAPVAWATTTRSGGGLWLSEGVATFGLVLVVLAVTRSSRLALAPFAVGAYIGAASFFTSSTSFANPAVTVARSLSDSFAGIAPSSVPMFIVMQLVGAAVAYTLIRFLFPPGVAAESVS
jgi:arsenate reductase